MRENQLVVERKNKLLINIIDCMSFLIIIIINYPKKYEKTKKVGIEKIKGFFLLINIINF